MFSRDLSHDGFYVFDKAHAQHFVGFIQHQTAQVREVQGAAFQVVQQAAWGTHNDLRALAQSAQLHVVTLAAVQGYHVDAVHVFGEIGHRFGNLNRQFAGRCQHQDLRCFQVCLQVVQQRQRERCSFTTTGLCHAQHVAAVQQVRNTLSLDRRWFFIAQIVQGGNDWSRQPQISKRGFKLSRHVHVPH